MINHRLTHKTHKRIAKTLHRLISPFGLYSKSHVNTDGYIFSIQTSLNSLEEKLESKGFIRNPTSFLTYRRIDEEKNFTIGSWAYYPNGLLGTKQIHITLYSNFDDGFVDVYGHKEDAWLRHPIKHLRGDNYSIDLGKKFVNGKFPSDWGHIVERSAEERYENS